MLLVDKPLHCLRKSADLPSRPSCTPCIYTGRLTQIPNGELHRFSVSSARLAEIAFAEVIPQGLAICDEGQAGRMDSFEQLHHDFTWKTASNHPEAADSIPWQWTRDAAQFKVERCYKQGIYCLLALSDHLRIQMDKLTQLVHPAGVVNSRLIPW